MLFLTSLIPDITYLGTKRWGFNSKYQPLILNINNLGSHIMCSQAKFGMFYTQHLANNTLSACHTHTYLWFIVPRDGALTQDIKHNLSLKGEYMNN